MSGRFVVLEGVEGAGKSTQLTLLAHWLRETRGQVSITREPGGTPLGEEIRCMLLGRRDGGMHPDTEILLMFAARCEHIAQVLHPRLEAGDWVLCDRFTDATYAYQGGGRGRESSRIAVLEQWVQDSLRPDLVLLLDLPVEESLARAERRGEADRFEAERQEFFERVRASYLERAHSQPHRYRIIDASSDIATVQRQLRAAVCECLGGPGD